MNKITLLLVCLSFWVVEVSGGNIRRDSLTSERESPVCLMPAIGGGLVLFGSLLDFDHGGTALGVAYKPSFDYKADEVLRFVPAAALVGMKAFGVESRTEKWGELMVRSVASTAVMGVAVESIKRLSKRVRPDGSNDRSFPSGHSAAAFLTASLFAKEYGHLSPWYSVGAYGVATSTAMLRRINDKHWTSDVMVGAGIGILSVELGYALADMFYKESKKSVLYRLPSDEVLHSCGLYMHYALPHTLSGTVDGRGVRSCFGYSVGMEAVCHFNPYVGVGGRLGITSSQMEVCSGEVWHTAERPLDQVSVSVGPHVKFPLCGGFSVGGHLYGGYGFYPRFDDVGLSLPSSKGWGGEGGVSVGYLTKQNVSLHLVADYRLWESPAEGLDNRGVSFGISAGWGW